MGKSNYLENKVLDHLLGRTTYTAPATVYVALYTTAPTDAGGGTEVSGGGYARKAVANDATNWPAAAGGSKSNGTAIVFDEASSDWGTVEAFGIFDAAIGGNLLYWGAVTPAKTVNNGQTARFPAGSLVISED